LSSAFTEKYFLFRVFRAWIYAAFASFFRTSRRALFKEFSLKFLYKPDTSTKFLYHLIYLFFGGLSSKIEEIIDKLIKIIKEN